MKDNSSTQPDEFPELVQHKSCNARIYRQRHRDVYRYEVRYHDADGLPQRTTFASYQEARDTASALVRQLANGGLDMTTLRGKERFVYENALDLLRPTGLTLDAAVAQLAESMKILDGVASLREAAELTRRHRPKTAINISVQAVVDELVKAKEADGLSKLYQRDLRNRLGQFARFFRCPIGYITTPDIERFLRSLKVCRRTRKNFLTTIGTLLNFAKAQGHLPEDHPGVQRVAKQRNDPPNIGVLTPDEMARLLAAAKGEMLLALALGGFAGLRSAEIARLDWSFVKIEEGHIEVPGRIAKTGIRRLPPIADNLREWLRFQQKTSGPVCSYKNLPNQWLKLAKRVGVEWKRNALRHSFISYRVAITKNIPQTALEAGNSVAIIQQHYLKMVTESQAKAWFSIKPSPPTNVIDLPQAAAVPAQKETQVAACT